MPGVEQELRLKTIFLLATASILIVLVALVLLQYFGGEGGSAESLRGFFLVNIVIVIVNMIAGLYIWKPRETIIDELFLMTPSGLLVRHYTRRLRPDQDADILAGMLTAVQNFIRDSFREGSGKLSEIRFEDYDIVLANSEHLILAAVISTKKPEKLRERLRLATSEVEKKVGPRLANWTGDRADLVEIEGIMKRLVGGRY